MALVCCPFAVENLSAGKAKKAERKKLYTDRAKQDLRAWLSDSGDAEFRTEAMEEETADAAS